MFGELQGYDGCELTGIALGGGRHLGNLGTPHEARFAAQAHGPRLYPHRIHRYPRHHLLNHES